MAQFSDEMRHVFDVHRLVFRIGELASMTQVSPRQLRYWEKKQLIKSREREGEQARVYTFGTFVQVSMIKYYLDNGYTLTAAAAKAQERDSRAKLLRRFIFKGLRGFAEMDGQVAINMGAFDDQQTLMALVPEEGTVTYRLVPNAEARRLTQGLPD